MLRAGALGRPRGMGWRGRRERGSGWGTHVNPWLIHVNIWQKPLQYRKVISFQLIKINGKKFFFLFQESKPVFLNSSYYIYFFPHITNSWFLSSCFRPVILNLGCTFESTEAFQNNNIRKLQHIFTGFINIMGYIIHRKYGIYLACEGCDSEFQLLKEIIVWP